MKTVSDIKNKTVRRTVWILLVLAVLTVMPLIIFLTVLLSFMKNGITSAYYNFIEFFKIENYSGIISSWND